MQFTDSTALCEHIRQVSGEDVILMFSCGKDSFAALAQLRQHFAHVHLVYMYRVPGLRFVEQRLVRYEELLAQPILRLPHPWLPDALRRLVFQPPERAAAIDRMGVPRYTYEDVDAAARFRLKLPGAYIATGERVADNPGRRAHVSKDGPLNAKRRSFAAVYDWSDDQVEQAVAASGIPLPEDYILFGRSFDGLDYRFLEPLSRAYPDDYATILRWFPLASLELRRREWAA